MNKVQTKVIKPLTGPVEGAVVTVYDVDGSLASIYSDAGGLLSISGSQIATDASGLVEYYVAPGAYFHQAQIAGEATRLEAVWVPEETLVDPGGGGATATNLSYASSPLGGTVISDTGTDASLPLADELYAGLMSPVQHAKLAGVAAGATANVGTVTSVALAVPPGFAVTGSPITGSGTLTLTFQADYALPTLTSQTQWSTAYTDRFKWDGGATGLNAATGRTSLGLGTAAVLDVPASGNAASNQVVLGSDTRLTGGGGGTATNLSYTASPTGGTVVSDTGTDASLPLVDATNAGLMAPAQHTKLAGIADGATANTGTVTSVSLSVPTGLSVSGSPVTGSGTLAIAYASGYSVPTTTAQGQWDTAYTDRLKWDGGAAGLDAATGRASLGLAAIASSGAYGDLSGAPVWVYEYIWQMILSGPTAGISAGSRGGTYAGVAGTVTAIAVVCDPNAKPTGSNVIINLQKVDLATGVATDLCSPDSTIAVGSATGSGTVIPAAATVTATTWLEAVCVQGDSAVKSVSIIVTITRS